MKELFQGKCVAVGIVVGLFTGFACMGCGNASYQDGVRKADEELKSGTPCIYTISMADVGKTDPKTGLPYLVLESPVTPELLDQIKGHNATIYSQYDAKGQLKP